jgi:hypothetical protein
MLGGFGLADLVEAARDRLLDPGDAKEWMDALFDYWSPADIHGIMLPGRKTPSQIADEVVRRARENQFLWASKTCEAYAEATGVPLGWGLPSWRDFHDAVVLAERIDSFLGTLEGGGPAAPLARDCRADLDLLLVLADWCQDAGQTRAAAEARHLHGLACAVLRG